MCLVHKNSKHSHQKYQFQQDHGLTVENGGKRKLIFHCPQLECKTVMGRAVRAFPRPPPIGVDLVRTARGLTD